MEELAREDFRRLFTSQVQRPEAGLQLDLAALYLAGEEYPFLDVAAYRNQLDVIADEVHNVASDPDDERSLIDALGRRLFDQDGFSGNVDNYYAAENNFFNRVLDTHMGMPVALSLVYLEIGRRLGIRCQGVGLPGYFLVWLEELDLYLDPYNQGRLHSAADCRRLVREMTGHHVPWRKEFLSPYGKCDILYRMLNNLKGFYFKSGDYLRASSCLERMALISPYAFHLNRDLCWCYANIHRSETAIRHLETYLQSAWPSQGTPEFQGHVESLWSAIHYASQQSKSP